MSSQDFARYTAKQVRVHCEQNHRQVALDGHGYQMQQQAALARCDRLEREAHEEAKAFRTWRTGFMAPRRDAWGHFGVATEQAKLRAHRELIGLRNAWAGLESLLTDEEREAWRKGTY